MPIFTVILKGVATLRLEAENIEENATSVALWSSKKVVAIFPKEALAACYAEEAEVKKPNGTGPWT